jgi:hypothetical protein
MSGLSHLSFLIFFALFVSLCFISDTWGCNGTYRLWVCLGSS